MIRERIGIFQFHCKKRTEGSYHEAPHRFRPSRARSLCSWAAE